MISKEFAKLFLKSLKILVDAGHNIEIPHNMTMDFMKKIILLATKIK